MDHAWPPYFWDTMVLFESSQRPSSWFPLNTEELLWEKLELAWEPSLGSSLVEPSISLLSLSINSLSLLSKFHVSDVSRICLWADFEVWGIRDMGNLKRNLIWFWLFLLGLAFWRGFLLVPQGPWFPSGYLKKACQSCWVENYSFFVLSMYFLQSEKFSRYFFFQKKNLYSCFGFFLKEQSHFCQKPSSSLPRKHRIQV